MTDELDNKIYSQEEINAAREELKDMTPEDLLTLRGELNRALNNVSLPEAVAICWTEVYSAKGNKINVTCRGVSGQQALDELVNTLRYARDSFGLAPVRPQAQAPDQNPQPPEEARYVPDAAESSGMPTNIKTEDIAVTSISRERKRDGKGDYLRVKGGIFTLYGAPAYDNVYPQGFDIAKLTYGIEVSPPVGMRIARVQAEVNKDGKMSHAKVLSFS